MSCPFKHLWTSESAGHGSKHVSGSDDLVSESASKLASVTLKPGEENGGISTETPSKPAAATCPMGFGARADASSDGGPSASAPSAPLATAGATCPLGFGSFSGPKLTNLHCIICKSFLYDCVKTNCGHQYCRHCISRFRDCPTCGADVTSVESFPESQSVVESFLSAHAGDTSIWQVEGLVKKEDEEEEETGKAAFLLQVGLRALSGGNPSSAAYRLRQCMDELEKQLVEVEKVEEKIDVGGKVEILNKMGAVAGCLGDCHRALGDAEQAVQNYTQSAALLGQVIKYSHTLEEASVISSKEEEERENKNFISLENGNAGSSAVQAVQSLSVTINKIGEIYHLQGDLEHALEKYKEALVLRQSRLEERKRVLLTNRDGGDGAAAAISYNSQLYIEAALDVAVSHVKVANILETIHAEKNQEKEGENGEKEKIEEERELRENEKAARELLQEIESKMNENGDVVTVDVKRKVEMLKTHLGN